MKVIPKDRLVAICERRIARPRSAHDAEVAEELLQIVESIRTRDIAEGQSDTPKWYSTLSYINGALNMLQAVLPEGGVKDMVGELVELVGDIVLDVAGKSAE